MTFWAYWYMDKPWHANNKPQDTDASTTDTILERTEALAEKMRPDATAIGRSVSAEPAWYDDERECTLTFKNYIADDE